MDIPLTTRQAYSEVDNILDLLDEEDRNKVPEKLRQLFKIEKDKEYVKNIDVSKAIEEQNLKEETLVLIALLNLKYWCTDEEEKEKLKKIYNENENIYQNELLKKYDTDNLFKIKKDIDGKDIQVDKEKNDIIKYKESKFLKIVNRIKLIVNKILKAFH